jgi:hypothetical protein
LNYLIIKDSFRHGKRQRFGLPVQAWRVVKRDRRASCERRLARAARCVKIANGETRQNDGQVDA